MRHRRIAMLAFACAALAVSVAAASGCIDVVRDSTSSVDTPTADSGPSSDGAATDGAATDGAPQPADTGAAADDNVCSSAFFSADFDTMAVPATNWSSLYNSAELAADAGSGAGGTISLVEAGTTAPHAVEFRTFGENRPRGAGVFLRRDVTGDSDCLGLAFDIFAPQASGGAQIFVAFVAPTTDTSVGLVLDTSGQGAPQLTFISTTPPTGSAPSMQVIGSAVSEYSRWYHVTITLRRQGTKMFAARTEITSSGSVAPTRFDSVLAAGGGASTASISLGPRHFTPAASHIIADTVRVTVDP